MPIEIVAAVQLGLYGLAWAVAAVLIRDHRAVLAYWSVYALLETLAAVLAIPSLTTGAPIDPLALATSFASYCAGVAGIDRFAARGPRLNRFVATCLAAALGGLVLLRLAVLVTPSSSLDPYLLARSAHLVYSIASAILWLGAAPSLWRRLRLELKRSTSLVALAPGFSLGLLALASMAMDLFVHAPQAAQVREAVRLPNLIVAMVASAIFHFGFLFMLVSRLLSRLQRLASRDHLTGLVNRRETEAVVAAACARHARDGTVFAVAIVDLDHFKQVNDTRGHTAGDEALRFAASALSDGTRPYDVVGRWGGEEFVVVMPGTDEVAALAAAERMRHLIESGSTPALGFALTASVGIALCSTQGSISTDQLVATADQALYEAKHAGRNKVCMRQVGSVGAVAAVVRMQA